MLDVGPVQRQVAVVVGQQRQERAFVHEDEPQELAQRNQREHREHDPFGARPGRYGRRVGPLRADGEEPGDHTNSQCEGGDDRTERAGQPGEEGGSQYRSGAEADAAQQHGLGPAR